MVTRTMSLYEALQEKKLIEKKLNNASSLEYFFVAKQQDETINGVSKETAKNNAISAFQSRSTLIKNLREYQQKIAEANGVTKVMIAGKEYTLTGAISRYNTLVYEKSFLNDIKQQLDDCLKEITITNNKVSDSDAVAGYLAKIFGDSKKTDEMVKSTTESYIKNHTVHLIDPNGLHDKLPQMIEDCLAFEKEFHFKINEANFKTEVTVELE